MRGGEWKGKEEKEWEGRTGMAGSIREGKEGENEKENKGSGKRRRRREGRKKAKFQSYIFQPCYLFRQIPVLHFQTPLTYVPSLCAMSNAAGY